MVGPSRWSEVRPARRLCAALAAAAACALATAPVALGDAAPHIYWIDPFSHSVGESNLDGTGSNQQIAQAVAPSAVAVSGQYVYWTDDGTNSIGRANLDGSNVDPTFITGANEPAGIAVDNRHIYWDNWFGGTIGEADVSGQNVNQNFIQVGGDLVELAVDGQYLYWANDDPWSPGSADPPGIGRARLDGSDVQPNFITANPQGVPLNIQGVAADDAHVYWTDCCNDIGVADLDGTQINTQWTGDFGVGQLSVDANKLFAAAPGQFPGWVNSLNLDGSDITQFAEIGDGEGPSALAVSVPVARVSPASPPAFGSRAVGSLSSPQILTLSNAGENVLDVHGLTFSGADPGDFVVAGNTCRGDIEPGDSCQVLVSFAPQGTGARSATLEIASTDYANSPTQIPLSGTGASSQFGPTTASIWCTSSKGLTTATLSCTVTYTYGPSSALVASAARVEVKANIRGRQKVVGTGRIRNHRVTLHLWRMRRGRHRLTLLRLRKAHHRPVVIGHTTVYVR